jgi:hypothetical protein
VPLALVHVDPDEWTVQGVWLSPTSRAYLRTASGLKSESIGQEVMASRGSGPSWDEWCEHLAQRTPTVALWRAIPRNHGEEARHVLARAVAMEAVENRSKRDAAG